MNDNCVCVHCGGSGRTPLANATLLNVILDCGLEFFTVHDLVKRAKTNAALRAKLKGYSTRSLGKLLTTLEGQRIDDLMLERVCKERNRVLRRVVAWC